MLRLLVSRRGSWSYFSTEINSNFYFLEVNSHWFLFSFYNDLKENKNKRKKSLLDLKTRLFFSDMKSLLLASFKYKQCKQIFATFRLML
jgi:hypothetical protein